MMIVTILLIIAFVLASIVILYGLRPLYLTGRKECNSPESINCHPVSVIVYAGVINDYLRQYIESVMMQDYPNMKVIIVCHADSENTTSLADEYSGRYHNLYFTFIPPGAENQSKHKLANLVGIKAADTDFVLTTNIFCRIPSNSWITEMMRPFNESDSTDLVLGYASPIFKEIKSPSKWYREFDYVMTSASWIGYADMGKAYRGDGCNMAFRRDLFFKNNGYVSSNRIHGGDDDMFVSEISNSVNTAVVLAPDSQLELDWGLSTSRMLSSLKERYKFTSRFLRKGYMLRNAVSAISQWIVMLATVSVFILCWTCGFIPLADKIIFSSVATIILLAMFGVEIYLYRRAATRLQAIRLWWSVPFFMLWRPLGDFIFDLRHLKTKANNFIWK